MKTKILELQLIGKRIKLVYGDSRKASMVRESSSDPEYVEDLERYRGGLVQIFSPDLDPDNLDYFIWINPESDRYIGSSPILNLVEGVLEFIDSQVIDLVLKDRDSFPEDVEAYIKSSLFGLGLEFLGEVTKIPEIERFNHKIRGVINIRNLYILKFVDCDKINEGRLIWDLTDRNIYEIHLKNDKSDLDTWKSLLHEVIYLSKIRFPEAGGQLKTELTTYLFRLFFNGIRVRS